MIPALVSKIKTFRGLPLREKLWFFFLYPYSGIVRAVVLWCPFRYLSQALGHHHANYTLSSVVSEADRQLAWRIGRIIELTARYTPWECKCLVQAAMARTLLGFYGIPYVMHLGARMTEDPAAPMKAHAWVKVGPWIVTGGEGHAAFGVVSTFVTPSVIATDAGSSH